MAGRPADRPLRAAHAPLARAGADPDAPPARPAVRRRLTKRALLPGGSERATHLIGPEIPSGFLVVGADEAPRMCLSESSSPCSQIPSAETGIPGNMTPGTECAAIRSRFTMLVKFTSTIEVPRSNLIAASPCRRSRLSSAVAPIMRPCHVALSFSLGALPDGTPQAPIVIPPPKASVVKTLKWTWSMPPDKARSPSDRLPKSLTPFFVRTPLHSTSLQ